MQSFSYILRFFIIFLINRLKLLFLKITRDAFPATKVGKEWSRRIFNFWAKSIWHLRWLFLKYIQITTESIKFSKIFVDKVKSVVFRYLRAKNYIYIYIYIYIIYIYIYYIYYVYIFCIY